MKARKAPGTSDPGLAKGYRSGLEGVTGEQLTSKGLDPNLIYESIKIEYVKPARKAKYTPDWPLPNGIIVETKGRFTTEDRQKHVFIKQQRPDLDIRFVFSNSRTRIRKGSPTTYADWCNKNGFKFADKRIPDEWFSEVPKP